MTNDSKHTPAPWFINYMELTGRVNLVDINNEGIAAFSLDGHPNEHDAHLIAAAPDMLEALEDCYEFVKFQCDMHDAGQIDKGDFCLLEYIETIINKARGVEITC